MSIHHKLWNYLHTKALLPGDYTEWRERAEQLLGTDCFSTWKAFEEENPPDFSTEEARFAWTVKGHNHVNEKLGKPLLSVEEASKIHQRPAPPKPLEKPQRVVETLITWENLTRDTLTLTQMLLERHPDIGGVAGCPRSGIRVASEIAINLGIPLYSATKESGLTECKSGVRLRDHLVHGPRTGFEQGQIVLIEDSTCSGFSVIELRSNPQLANLPVYAVYGASPGKDKIDGYAVHKELPHWFEWNLWNNGQILKDFNTAIDWDGILNPDCTHEQDDDGTEYTKWLSSVRPIRIPRSYKVPFIVTARREAYRKLAEAWLDKYKINYGELVMFPGTHKERSGTCIGSWKAEEAVKRNCQMFIESCPHQAQVILNKSNMRVLCPTQNAHTEKTPVV